MKWETYGLSKIWFQNVAENLASNHCVFGKTSKRGRHEIFVLQCNSRSNQSVRYRVFTTGNQIRVDSLHPIHSFLLYLVIFIALAVFALFLSLVLFLLDDIKMQVATLVLECYLKGDVLKGLVHFWVG